MASSDSASWVAGASSLKTNPASTTASAAMASDPPALPTIATCRPGGRGWLVSTRAVSSMAASVGTWMTPVCSRRAASVSSRPTDAIEVGSRPAFTVTTGLARLRRRARRLKWRGFPRLSMYMHTTSVLSSLVQYWSRSLLDTSARLPRATKDEMPIPRSRACPMIAAPTIPDSESSDTRPRRGTTLAKVACKRTSGSVLMIPRQFGPTTRTPQERATRSTSASRAVPSAPSSLNPAERITTPYTCLRPHSSTTAATESAGTAITARSTSSGMSRMLGAARTVATWCALGFTGHTGPAKPARWRFWTTAWPTLLASRPAPMTATLRGESNLRTATAAAVRARSSMAASAAGVGCRPKRTSTTPSAKRVAVSNPACVKTPIIFRLSGSTEAVKAVSPTSRARAARCSRSTVARPRPWLASSTKKATSASERCRQRS